jgi:hypothetical protein
MDLELILSILEKRLKEIESKYSYLSHLIEERHANEKLFQLEVMRILSLLPDVVEYLPERHYPHSSQKCDFWFKTKDDIEHWMEIKTRPTNYRKIKHAKAITHGIDDVIEDANRLIEKTDKNSQKYILFALYPIYPESNTFLTKHLKKIGGALGKVINKPNIEIECHNGAFHVYLLKI